jgi:endonuclease-3
MTTTPSRSKMKASDRQTVMRRVTSLLQKRYGRSIPKSNRDVLQTLLFGITLENASHDAAEAALNRLISAFHDLNEIRVSSITELEGLLDSVPASDWKALRIREALQFTFEKYYSFDLESLKRKTMDVAEKQLAKIAYLTPFARNYVLQNSLGSHVIPIDDATRLALQWMGLASLGADNDAVAEEVKSAVRKQDAQLTCHLLHELVTDRKYVGTFEIRSAGDGDEPDGTTAAERLKHHLAHPPKPAKKSVKKSRKRPPASASSTKRKKKPTTGTVRKRVTKPKTSSARRTRR